VDKALAGSESLEGTGNGTEVGLCIRGRIAFEITNLPQSLKMVVQMLIGKADSSKMRRN